MTDAMKQAAQQALLDCLPKVGEPEARFTMVETKDLRAALAAPQPAAPQADPCAPPEIQEAIERGEFEPGQWTVSAQRAIEKNPSGALRIIARLRDEVAGLKAAPAPAQAMPRLRDVCTDPDNCKRCKAPTWEQPTLDHAGIPVGPQQPKAIKQPGSEAC